MPAVIESAKDEKNETEAEERSRPDNTVKHEGMRQHIMEDLTQSETINMQLLSMGTFFTGTLKRLQGMAYKISTNIIDGFKLFMILAFIEK